MTVEFDYQRLETSINKVVGAIDKLDKRVQDSQTTFTDFYKVFSNSAGFDQFVKSIAKIDIETSRSFKNLASGIDAISKSFIRLKDINQTNVQNFSKAIYDLTAVVQNIPTFRSSNLNSIGEIAKVAAKLTSALSKVGDINPNINIQNFTKAVTGLFNALKVASAVSGALPGLQQIELLATSLNRITFSLGRVIQYVDKIPDKAIRKMATFFLGLSAALQIVSKVVSAVPGGNELDELSKVFDRLGRGFGSLIRFSKYLDPSTIFRVVTSIAALSVGLRAVSRLAGNSKRLTAFSQALASITQFYNTFANLDKKNLDKEKDFRIALRGLVKAFNELNHLKIDANKLRALQLAQSINLNKVLFTSNAPVNEGFRESVIRGIGFEIGSSLFSGLYSYLKGALSGSAITELFDNIGKRALNLGRQLQTTGTAIFQNFGVMALTQSQGFESAASFDQLISQLKVFGDLTDEQALRAQNFANQIGIKYPLSANDALQAILDLTKAGQDLNAIEFILPSAADLAALGGIEVETTTKAIIGAVGAFREFKESISGSFQNSSVAADLFSAAADVSTASVQSLIDGLANVGPTANNAGLTLQETLSILSQFEDANIRGAESGTALRSVLNSLVSDRAKNELKFLTEFLSREGISGIDLSLANADGSLRSLDELIKSLNAAYRSLGFTESEINESVAKLADTYARQGFAILLANNGYQATVDRLDQVESASVRAVRMLDNFKGEMLQLAGSVETANTRAFLPMIRNAFRPLVQIGRRVVDFFNALPDSVVETVSNAVLLSSAIATIAGGFIVLVGVITSFGGALLSAAGTLVLFSTNATAAFIGIGGLLASLSALAVIAITVTAAVASAAEFLTRFRIAVAENIGGAGDAFERFKSAIENAFEAIGPLFNELGRLVSIVFGGNGARFGERVAGFFNRMTDGARQLRVNLTQLTAIFEVFRNFVSASFGGETASETRELNNQLARLSRLPLIRSLFGGNVNPAALRQIFELGRTGLVRLGSSIKDTFSGAVGVLFGEAGAQQKLESGVSNFFGTISRIADRLAPNFGFGEAIGLFDEGKVGDGLVILFRNILNRVRNFLANSADGIASIGQAIFRFINPLNGVQFILRILGLENASTAVGDAISVISDGIGKAIRSIFQILGGKNVSEVLLGNFGEAARPFITLGRSVKRVLDGIFGAIAKVIEVLFPPNSNASIDAGGIIGTILNGISAALDFFAAVIQNIVTELPKFVDNVSKVIYVIERAIAPLINFGKVFIENFQKLLSGDVSFSDFARRIGSELTSAIGRTLANIGSDFDSEFLTSLGEALTRGDLRGAAQIVGDKLGELLRSGIAAAGRLLINVGQGIGSEILVSIGNDLQKGDYTNALNTISGAIRDLIADAISLVPDLIGTIGNILGVPILENIAAALANPDNGSEIIPVIADNIANIIKNAIDRVPEAIEKLGIILNLPFLENLGKSLKEITPFAVAFNLLKNALYGLSNLALDSIAGGLKAIADVFTTPISPVGLLFLGGIGSVFAAASGASFAGATALFASIGNLFAKIGNFAAVIVVFSAITNFLKNIDDFLKGDIAAGLLETFVGLFDTLIAFTGLEEILFGKDGFDEQKFVRYARGIVLFVETLVNRLSEALTVGIGNLIDGLLLEVNRFRFLITIDNTKAKEQFNRVADAAEKLRVALTVPESEVRTSNIFDQLERISADLQDPAELETLQLQLRTQTPLIDQIFDELDGNLGELSSEQFGNLVNVLLGGGRLDDAFVKIANEQGPEAIQAFVNRIFDTNNVSSALLGAFKFEGFIDQIAQKALRFEISPQAAANLIASTAQTGLIPPGIARQAALDIANQFNDRVAEQGGMPVDIAAINVQFDQAQVNLENRQTRIVQQQIENELEAAIDTGALEVQFSFLSAALVVPAIVAGLDSKFIKERTQQALEETFAALGELSVDQQVLLIDNLIPTVRYEAIRSALTEIRNQLAGEVTATAENGLMPTALPFEIIADVTVTPNSVDVTPVLTEIERQLSRRTRTSGPSAFGFGTSNRNIPGRASGGQLLPYSVYGVHDTPNPELAMFKDGTSLLFTGQAAGRMVKIVGMASAPTRTFTREQFKEQNRKRRTVDEDDLRKAQDRLVKIIEDYTFKESEAKRKAQEADLEAQEEYQRSLQKLQVEGRTSVLEAIRRGDGAAARSSVINQRKQLEELEYNFSKQNEQRKKRLDEELALLARERLERSIEAGERIDELRKRYQSEEELEQEAYDEQFADLVQANQRTRNELSRHNAALYDDQEATFRGIERLTDDALTTAEQDVANFTTTVTQGVSLIDQVAQRLYQTLSQLVNPLPALPGSQPSPPSITPPNPFTPGVGQFPSNPQTGQTFVDSLGQMWVYLGGSWRRAYSSPGRANGGPINPWGAYRVFDGNRPELVSMRNGQSLLLSGANGGRIVPLAPTQRGSYNGYGTNSVNITVDIGGVYSNASDPMEVAALVEDMVVPKIAEAIERGRHHSTSLVNPRVVR